ncbi:hypothetical protein [Streptomyces sp. NPDC102487]|uniref:hypothetical protein n=1 Tax=Streptomyces sp. NPDC102487 TaxID=3366182 RepID=UPI0037F82A7C
MNDREMPLDEYLLNPSESESVSSAYLLSISKCMRQYGLTFNVPKEQSRSGAKDDAPKTRTDGRFGFQSIKHARKWGYHSADDVFREPAKHKNQSIEKPDGWFALTGSRSLGEAFGPGGVSRSGSQVPERGCVGTALLQITGSRNGNIGDAKLVTNLKFSTLIKGQKDPETLKVFSLWAHCMKNLTYSYGSPLEPMRDPLWLKSTKPSAEEINTAVADQKCRAKYNVVGVWYVADLKYQKQAVKENQRQLIAAKRNKIRQVRAARKILGK